MADFIATNLLVGTDGAHQQRPQQVRFWGRLNEEWRRSGRSQAEFCRRKGISLSVFRWWRYRGLRFHPRPHSGISRATSSSSLRPAFVPVRIVKPKPRELPASPLPNGADASAPLEIVLAGGRVLRVRDDFNPALVRKLLQILEEEGQGPAFQSC